jgi:hypothetical protein
MRCDGLSSSDAEALREVYGHLVAATDALTSIPATTNVTSIESETISTCLDSLTASLGARTGEAGN